MKKMIALTGSFNPVTVAHYKILSDAVERFDCDEGIFIAIDQSVKKTGFMNCIIIEE